MADLEVWDDFAETGLHFKHYLQKGHPEQSEGPAATDESRGPFLSIPV